MKCVVTCVASWVSSVSCGSGSLQATVVGEQHGCVPGGGETHWERGRKPWTRGGTRGQVAARTGVRRAHLRRATRSVVATPRGNSSVLLQLYSVSQPRAVPGSRKTPLLRGKTNKQTKIKNRDFCSVGAPGSRVAAQLPEPELCVCGAGGAAAPGWERVREPRVRGGERAGALWRRGAARVSGSARARALPGRAWGGRASARGESAGSEACGTCRLCGWAAAGTPPPQPRRHRRWHWELHLEKVPDPWALNPDAEGSSARPGPAAAHFALPPAPGCPSCSAVLPDPKDGR